MFDDTSSTLGLEQLSNDELLTRTQRVVGCGNQLLAALLAHLGEVEARGIHRERSCASLYTYCVYELRLSEDSALRRVKAARFVRQFPALLGAVARGELHLTGLLLLGPHLTEANLVDVLARAKHRTKKEIEKLVRKLDPLPEVSHALPNAGLVDVHRLALESLKRELRKRKYAETTRSASSKEKDPPCEATRSPESKPGAEAMQGAEALQSRVSKQTRETKHRGPSAGQAPRKKAPAEVRRRVVRRDLERCTYIDECGQRCRETRFLEFHHVQAHALDGPETEENLTLRCRAHNALAAEEDFGRDFMQQKQGRADPRQRGDSKPRGGERSL